MKSLQSFLKRLGMFVFMFLSSPLGTLASTTDSQNTKFNNAINAVGEAGFGQTLEAGSTPGLSGVVGAVATVVLGFTGTVVFVIFIYAGYLWITARGNEDQVKDAKKYLINATIGTIILVMSYALAYFITITIYGVTS